jgi:hypothetical protein
MADDRRNAPLIGATGQLSMRLSGCSPIKFLFYKTVPKRGRTGDVALVGAPDNYKIFLHTGRRWMRFPREVAEPG